MYFTLHADKLMLCKNTVLNSKASYLIKVHREVVPTLCIVNHIKNKKKKQRESEKDEGLDQRRDNDGLPKKYCDETGASEVSGLGP